MSDNPFASHESGLVTSVSAPADADTIRQANLRHEGFVRTAGVLLLIAAGLLALSAAITSRMETSMAAITARSGRGTSLLAVHDLGMEWLSLCIAVLLGTGCGLRLLKPWARFLGALVYPLSMLGYPICFGIGSYSAGFPIVLYWPLLMLSFPVSGVVGFYALSVFLGKRGRRIFSADYAAVVQATPHRKSQVSKLFFFTGLAMLALLFYFSVCPSDWRSS